MTHSELMFIKVLSGRLVDKCLTPNDENRDESTKNHRHTQDVENSKIDGNSACIGQSCDVDILVV